jgi:hypothetical protein
VNTVEVASRGYPPACGLTVELDQMRVSSILSVALAGEDGTGGPFCGGCASLLPGLRPTGLEKQVRSFVFVSEYTPKIQQPACIYAAFNC